MKSKKDLTLVDVDGAVLHEDFEVVTNTEFDEALVTHMYYINNHDYDLELAETLGLGVVETYEGERLLYNADKSTLADRTDNEILRIGVYYQITHPEYDDKKLDELISLTGGREYLKLIQTNDSDEPYNRLKEIFDSKKGHVIQVNFGR